jgi:hypothetical protein
LVAEQLDDPPTWDRFLPCHTVDSERSKFECAVKEATGDFVKVALCKDLTRRGTSVFEYDWTIEEDFVLSHAMQVAHRLGLELVMESPATPVGEPRLQSA